MALMYSFRSQSPFWSSPSWGMDAAAVASPDAALYRDIQQLKSEVRVSCDGVARSYLDGMFGMHMLQEAEKASARERDSSNDSDSEEETSVMDLDTLPEYLEWRTDRVRAPLSESKQPSKLYHHRHFSRKLLSSACRRLRDIDSEDAPFEYKLLYLWHGSFVVQAFDCDSVNKDIHPRSTPSFTATLFFLGDTYEQQMMLLRPFLHSVLCEGFQVAGKREMRPRVRLSLNINYVLCSAPIYPVPGVPMVLRLQAALREKISKNWLGMPFISSIHVSQILDHNTIVHCLARDQKFFYGSEDDATEISRRLVTRWLLVAPGMLTMCLLNDQDFSSLEFLVREGITDNNFADSLVEEKYAAGLHEHSISLDALLSLNPSYDALHLVAGREVSEVRKDEVIPMFYDDTEPILRPDGRSEVRMVHFEPGYHEFSEDPLDTFILKKFRISPGGSTNTSYKDFLDLFHPHLVTHLGGWVSENELFLIFPSPALTLKDLLLSRKPIYSTKKGLDSIVEQLVGIRDAIEYLSRLQDSRKGFHHGVRPDNIYLFPVEQEKDLFTWKLGSFGTDSEMYNFSKRTKTTIEAGYSMKFAAPESRHDPEQLTDRTSKELDDLALGCVILVVLYWLLENDDHDILKLYRMSMPARLYRYRMWKPGEPFWKEEIHGEIVLQPSVTKFLDILRFHDSLPDSMKEVTHLASRYLAIDRKGHRPLGTIYGSEVAKLGLGVEPYIAQGYQQSQNVSAVGKAAQRPLAEHEEASTLITKSMVLPGQTLATRGVKSSTSDQPLDHNVGKLARDVAQNKQTAKPNPKDAIQANERAGKRAAFARGLIRWGELSSEEQKACIGPSTTLDLGDGICYEPEGQLKELWVTYLWPRVNEVLQIDRRLLIRHFPWRRTLGYMVQLVVLQQETSQQLRPTIVIIHAKQADSERGARLVKEFLRNNDPLKEGLASDCDVVGHTDIVRLLY